MKFDCRKLIASAATAAVLAGTGSAQAAVATATLDWFTFSSTLYALDEPLPAFTVDGNFSSYAWVYLQNGAQQDQVDAADWLSDLSASLPGANATVSGASFPPKGSDFDVNPLESLSAEASGTNSAGAEAGRTFQFVLGAQTLALFSIDYLLTVDVTGLNPLTSYTFSHVSLFAYSDDLTFQAISQTSAQYPSENGFLQGRLVLGVANASDEERTFVFDGKAGASLLAPVPEPAGWLTMFAGLAVVGIRVLRSGRFS